MAISRKLTDEELQFSFVLQDPILFALLFWPKELKLPMSIEQRILLADVSQKQLWCLGRKILKTLSIERDIMYAIVQHFLDDKGDVKEGLFLTPRDAHLIPTRNRIFEKINNTPFFNMLVRDKNKSGGGAGQIVSINGFTWHFRIEGMSGDDQNVIGLRLDYIRWDEGAFGTRAVYNSLIMSKFPGASVKITGVPNGVRDSFFYELDQKKSMSKGWSKHNYPSFINPIYADPAQRQELIDLYGGTQTQGYITQVLGLWGEESYTSFPPGSVAIKELSFKFIELNEKQILDNLTGLQRIVPLPVVNATFYCIGLDYGFSPDPTEIVVLYSNDRQTWLELARIRLLRVKAPNQAKFVDWLYRHLKNVLKISTDNLSLLQILSDDSVYGKRYQDKLKFADPGGATVVLDFDGKPMLDSEGKELKKRNKQFLTEALKDTFQAAMVGSTHPHYVWLASEDEFLLEAIHSMTERKTPAGYVVYETGRPESEHPKDALLYALDSVIASKEQTVTNFSEYESVLGWAGNPMGQALWSGPWNRSSG